MKSLADLQPCVRRGLLAIALALAAAVPRPTIAHKPVTARYNYEEDIRPIFETHCSPCHRPDGPTPMSLRTYDDARPWAEAIKEEVLLERMPPWPVRSGARFRNARVLSAGEIDRIADWVSGGTPRGKPAASGSVASTSAVSTPEPIAEPGSTSTPAVSAEGTQSLSLPVRHRLVAARQEEIVTTLFSSEDIGSRSVRWLRAIDFTAGDRRVVRSVRADLLPANASESAPGEFLFVWIPAARGIAYPVDSARRFPAGARVRLRIQYRRPWTLPKGDMTVESELRLSFARRSPRDEVVVRAFEVERDSPGSHRIAGQGVLLLAITPLVVAAAASTESEPDRRLELALRRDGTLQHLLETRSLQPEWSQRLRLAEPLAVDNEARIEARSSGRVVVWIEYLLNEGESGD